MLSSAVTSNISGLELSRCTLIALSSPAPGYLTPLSRLQRATVPSTASGLRALEVPR